MHAWSLREVCAPCQAETFIRYDWARHAREAAILLLPVAQRPAPCQNSVTPRQDLPRQRDIECSNTETVRVGAWRSAIQSHRMHEPSLRLSSCWLRFARAAGSTKPSRFASQPKWLREPW